MFRKICGLTLVGLLLIHTPPVSAEPERPKAPASAKARSTTKRVLWTIVGAGAGFAAGVFLGLNQFDDAINSDRKVWTTAIVGAVGGGVAGALISRNVGREPSVRSRRPAPSKSQQVLTSGPHEGAVRGVLTGGPHRFDLTRVLSDDPHGGPSRRVRMALMLTFDPSPRDAEVACRFESETTASTAPTSRGRWTC